VTKREELLRAVMHKIGQLVAQNPEIQELIDELPSVGFQPRIGIDIHLLDAQTQRAEAVAPPADDAAFLRSLRIDPGEPGEPR
jgi:hypothetical protein